MKICDLSKINPNVGDRIGITSFDLTCAFCSGKIHLENIVAVYDGDFMAGVDLKERVHVFLPLENDFVGCPHCGMSYRTTLTLYCPYIHEDTIIEVKNEAG